MLAPDTLLALAKGTVDGSEPPAVVTLSLPALTILREMRVPLGPKEPAKLHHGALSPDGEVAVVANMGPLHGERPGTTVAAFRWRTGTLLWRAETIRRAVHVRFLFRNRIIVLGHRASALAVLDARTGRRLETWRVPGASTTGHSLVVEAKGTVLLLDSSVGRLVRLGVSGVRLQFPRLGGGVTESSLPE